MASSRFRDGFQKALMAAARKVRRHVLTDPDLPPSIHDQMDRNRHLLSMCDEDLQDKWETEKALAFFNGDWSGPSMLHWCKPGCCVSEEECVQCLVCESSC